MSEDKSTTQHPRTHEERLIPDEDIAEDGQVYVDRSKIDFDPDDGLYTGSTVDGTSQIPGPHEGEGKGETS